jgi:diguanylate cyclase (GGDEF)-like protein
MHNKKMKLIISVILLIIVGFIDHVTKHTTLFLYVAAIAWVTNYIGGKYSYFFATAAVCTRIAMRFLPGSIEDIFDSLWVFLNQYGSYILIVFIILKKNEIMDEFEKTSLTDPLTSLSNRRGFKQKLDVAIAHTKRFKHQLSIAYLDVDRFKQVNDTYGHSKGDELLLCIAKHISRNLRADDHVARLGGDEFAIIFSHSDTSLTLIERIKNDLDHNCRDEYDVSFSIGVVHYDGSIPASGEDIIHYADELMYKVKKTSKNAILMDYFKEKS